MSAQYQLAAIMVTDVVDYSRLMGRDERAAMECLRHQRDVFAQHLAAHECRFHKEIGDGTLSAFPSARHAIECAEAILDTLLDQGAEYRIRIGIHVGDTVFDDDDVHGNGVNVAARLEPLARPDGIVISDSCWESVRNQPKWNFELLGQRSLGNIPGLVTVYRLNRSQPRSALHSRIRAVVRRIRPVFRRSAIIGTAATAVAIASMLLWHSAGVETTQAIDSVAVLPLVDSTGEPDLEYLGEDITESLISSLSRLPQLKRVIARTTAARYRGREIDPVAVGRELNVRAVFTGTLSRRGDELQVVAELVDTANGSRLWGASLRHPRDEAMHFQSELAGQIVEEMRLQLTGTQREQLASTSTTNAEAYRLYVAGRHYSELMTSQGTDKSIELLQQAVRIDPGYALAYAGLAEVYWAASSQFRPATEAMPMVKAAAEKALQLDDTLAEAHAARAMVLALYERDWAAGERELDRALQLNPGYARAAWMHGLIATMQGDMDRGIRYSERAHQLDPLSSQIHGWLAFCLFLNHRYADSIRETRNLIDADPYFHAAYYNLAFVYGQQGNFHDADVALMQLKAVEPDSPYTKGFTAHAFAISGRPEAAHQLLQELLLDGKERQYLDPWLPGLVYTGLGDRDKAFASLQEALRMRSDDLLLLKIDPRFESLHDDPRFQELLRALNLPP